MRHLRWYLVAFVAIAVNKLLGRGRGRLAVDQVPLARVLKRTRPAAELSR